MCVDEGNECLDPGRHAFALWHQRNHVRRRQFPLRQQVHELATLLLIGARGGGYALWLIGLALRSNGYRIEFGSRKKAAIALSVISLARWWAAESPTAMLSR